MGHTVNAMRRRFYSVAEVARETSLSPGMVRKLVDQGSLTAVRFGRTVRITDKSYQEFLERAAETA
jgi:excisionase family DNA binding protein